jgi:hypothetical protein
MRYADADGAASTTWIRLLKEAVRINAGRAVLEISAAIANGLRELAGNRRGPHFHWAPLTKDVQAIDFRCARRAARRPLMSAVLSRIDVNYEQAGRCRCLSDPPCLASRRADAARARGAQGPHPACCFKTPSCRITTSIPTCRTG